MTCPAIGSLMCRLAAMSGSRPMATNSVVPMPKPPTARAKTASHRTAGGGETTESGTDCGREEREVDCGREEREVDCGREERKVNCGRKERFGGRSSDLVTGPT